MSVRVILNPRAGAGAAAMRRTEIERELRRHGIAYSLSETSQRGDATQLAQVAREDGAETIAVAGGDGTLNEVAQAYLAQDGSVLDGPRIAMIPAGTGGDFRRNFDLGSSVRSQVERIASGTTRPLDLGLLAQKPGQPPNYAFLNIASFGLSALTGKIVNSAPKWMGAKLTYLLGGARALAVYRNQPVEIFLDGELWHRGPISVVAVANGQYYGGGMRIAPNADPSDGYLDVVAQCDMSLLQTVVATTKVYEGRHLGGRETKSARARVVLARPAFAQQDVLIEADGEAPGALPIEISIAPSALRLVV